MTKKVKFELEYVLRTSAKVLDKALTTPDGLSEWFADEVIVDDDVYTFKWDKSEEEARLVSKKAGSDGDKEPYTSSVDTCKNLKAALSGSGSSDQ
jgi:hypothetical protein